jgi:ABC-type multidrug transport system fused ATPase/permease subunit
MPVNRMRARDKTEAPKRRPELLKLMRELWRLVRRRKWFLLLGLLLVFIERLAGLVIPMVSKPFVNEVLMKHDINRLIPLVLEVCAATLVEAITAFSNAQLLPKAAHEMIGELRQEVQEHVGRLSISFYDTNRIGLLVSRIMSDVEGIRYLMGTEMIAFVGGLLTAGMAFAFLLHRDAMMTLMMVAVIAVFVLVLHKTLKTIRPIFRERAKIIGEVTARLTESLGGVRVVKGYHAEERESKVFSGGVRRLLANVAQSLTAISLLSMTGATTVGIVGVLVMLRTAHLSMQGRMGPGDYIQYTLFLGFMIGPVARVVNIGTQLTEAVAGLDRTMEILSEKDEFADAARVNILKKILGEIRFVDVRFSYEKDKPVLHGVSFEAQPGTVTALVGSSGSGKSTIIGLICAFHKPDNGHVLVDGVDLSTVRLNSYRNQLGVVLQESFLFDGSIRENVIFSNPEAIEEDFLLACRIARVDEFAERFAEGYDTIVGERGVKLSGGQRQRLSIARAILASPRILILDEATSSLDSDSEAMIQQGLSYLMQGRTTFVIAHRLSTIRRANQILVVEGGQIIERGTHVSLYARRGRYYDLYTHQHGLEKNLFLARDEGDAVEQSSDTTSGGNRAFTHTALGGFHRAKE